MNKTRTSSAARIIVRFMAGVERKTPSLCERVGRGSTANYPKVIKLIFTRYWWFPVVRFAPSPLPLSQRERELSFAACDFDLAFEINRQFLHSRFAHRLEPAKRLVEHAPLVLWPIRISGNASE